MAVFIRVCILVGCVITFSCPRCKQASIYQGLLSFHASCPACALPLATRDVGDGAIFLVMMVIGFAITLLATVVELAYTPPLWVHAALWLPLTCMSSIAGLRVARAFMIAVSYRQEVLHKEHV
jgi:uncharacterized protein (DUF983 family)